MREGKTWVAEATEEVTGKHFRVEVAERRGISGKRSLSEEETQQ